MDGRLVPFDGRRRIDQRMAEAAGFHIGTDPVTRQYAHPAGFVVVGPEGVISRYFLGIDFSPGEIAAALRRRPR